MENEWERLVNGPWGIEVRLQVSRVKNTGETMGNWTWYKDSIIYRKKYGGKPWSEEQREKKSVIGMWNVENIWCRMRYGVRKKGMKWGNEEWKEFWEWIVKHGDEEHRTKEGISSVSRSIDGRTWWTECEIWSLSTENEVWRIGTQSGIVEWYLS